MAQPSFRAGWDPKTLLNPKAAMQPKTNGASSPSTHNANAPFAARNQPNAPQPKMQFSFDTPGGSATNGSSNPLKKRQHHSDPELKFQFDTPVGGANGYTNGNMKAEQYKGQGYGHAHLKIAHAVIESSSNGHADGQTNGVKYDHMNGSGYKQENGHRMNGAPQPSFSMGHMLEKVHNVVDRSEVPQPQKRRKIEHIEDDQLEKRKALFAGGGQHGVLGEYMRKKAEEGKQEALIGNGRPQLQSMGSIDLTADDDVQEVTDPEDVEICYGRLEGAEVSTCKVPTPKPGTRALQPNHWPVIKVMLKRGSPATKIITVVDSTRQCFGSVDVNTAVGLCPIMDSSLQIRFSARILSREMKPGERAGQETSQRLKLDLVLYGPRRRAKEIGRHLSQKQLWLRQPFFIDAGIDYHNPHAELPNMVPRNGNRCLGYTSATSATQRTVEEVRSEVLGMFDNLRRSENMEESEPGPIIKTELLQHQKQGLTFMLAKEQERTFGEADKENSSLWRQKFSATGSKTYVNIITSQQQKESPPEVLGGILADMMGLGKTLSILSLIAKTKGSKAMVDWANSQPPPPTGEDPVPLKINSRATLLVSPLSTIANWETQIDEHVKPQGLKVHIYHGTSKCKLIKELADHDIVITTYGSVASEFSRREKKKAGCFPLQEINWFRIVLDEAHMIREQSTLNSKAICRLQAQRRWAVTGTPVQNRLDDLGALLKFLRLKPFDEKRSFAQHILGPCKSADPEIYGKLRLLVDSITLRRLKDRINLPARVDKIIKLEFSPSEQELYNIFAKNAKDRVKMLTAQQEKSLGGRSYVHILQSILRLRLICAHGRDLLDEEDLKLTQGISKDAAIDLDDEPEIRGLNPQQVYQMYNLMKETNADRCFVCATQIGGNTPDSEDGKEEVLGHMTPCFHLICRDCIKEHKRATLASSRDGGKTATCPLCHAENSADFFPLKASEADEALEGVDKIKGPKKRPPYNGPHTKTRELVRELLNHDEWSMLNPEEAPIKSVVFSTWTSHLDLIQRALEDHHITYTRLDGRMSRPARGQALDVFRTDPRIHVILVSISAGGLGLNLTTANKVYVMEPQYNPAAEAQAIDRVHRLGQVREVETVRFVMKDSFEEKMLELQEKKRKLASFTVDREKDVRGLVGGTRADATRKRLEDLRSLFK